MCVPLVFLIIEIAGHMPTQERDLRNDTIFFKSKYSSENGTVMKAIPAAKIFDAPKSTNAFANYLITLRSEYSENVWST